MYRLLKKTLEQRRRESGGKGDGEPSWVERREITSCRKRVPVPIITVCLSLRWAPLETSFRSIVATGPPLVRPTRSPPPPPPPASPPSAGRRRAPSAPHLRAGRVS